MNVITNRYSTFIFFLGADENTSHHFVEEDLSAQEMIDFSPVYRCLHISTVLGSRTTFETYYRSQRTKQARLVLQPPTNMVSFVKKIVTRFKNLRKLVA